MEEESNTIVDWNIENLSFWRSELHGHYIPNYAIILFSGLSFGAELHPKCPYGKGEYMVVKIIDAEFETSGKLSFIGSDGSVLFTEQVDIEKDKEQELSPGPKFMDVLAQIKKNEGRYKDKLTLRFQFHQKGNYFEHLIASTTIDVQKIPLKIDQGLIESIKQSSKYIFRNKDVSLKLVLEDRAVKFVLEPVIDRIFSVETFIRLMSSDNTLVRKEEQKHLFSKKNNTSWTFSDSIASKIFSGRGGVTVNLDLVVIQEETIDNSSSKLYKLFKSSENSVVNSEDSVTVLTKEFMCLYQDQEFSDFELKCGTASFPVHRNILSARSPVFKTMLSNDMKEASSGCMDIEDLDTPTLARFLTFLYTGAVEDLKVESALKLYYAADKYQVPSLKRECVDHLTSNIAVSNVCDVLSLADRHSDEGLAATSRDFVLDNYNQVLKSKEWEKFIEGESLLAVKLLTNFAAKDCVVKKPGS